MNIKNIKTRMNNKKKTLVSCAIACLVTLVVVFICLNSESRWVRIPFV